MSVSISPKGLFHGLFAGAIGAVGVPLVGAPSRADRLARATGDSRPSAPKVAAAHAHALAGPRAGFFCVHVTSDRRGRGLSFTECAALSDLPDSSLAPEWESWSGRLWVGAVRHRGEMVCRCALVATTEAQRDDGATRRAARDYERSLRRQGERVDLAAVLREFPARPLIVTFARRAAFTPAMVSVAHRLSLAAAVRYARGGNVG